MYGHVRIFKKKSASKCTDCMFFCVCGNVRISYKKTAQIWIEPFLILDPGFVAAPVTGFHHAPVAQGWDSIIVGMKVGFYLHRID